MPRATLPAAALLSIVSTLGLAAATPAGAATAARSDADAPARPTYARDVAPILAEHCVSCHRPGDIAPMALRSYDEVRPWVKSIRRAVEDGAMPPWHADPAHGEFANDRSLSDVERDTLVRWIKEGAPRGEEAAAVPAGVNEGEGAWRLGAPDLEIQFEAVDLPEGGPDQFRDLVESYPLPEDRWVRAIEVQPGDRRVLHHIIVYVLEEGQQAPNGWLGAWAAGMEPMVFPAGTGRLLKKGSRLIGNMHYHPTDEPTRDETTIGLHFLDAEPEKELVNLWVQNSSFKIPAGAADHEVKSSYTFRQDSVVHALLPHMHYRGKDFVYTAVYPDGRREVLLKVPAYDFNWQTIYQLKQPLELPEGTRIECVAHYDNSTKNAANPDPTKDVTFGNESFDEMMIGFVDYTVKEGLRPMSAEERLATIRAELLAAHPGEVFAVRVWEQKDPAETGDAAPDEHTLADHVTAGTVAKHDTGEGASAGEAGAAASEVAEPQSLDTALHFPAAGGEGLWFIPFNGDVLEAKLSAVEGTAAAWKAMLVAPFGSLQVEGRGGFGGKTVAGTITMGNETMGFEGTAQ
jgi:mono/diheme cytochrome c family protein